MQKCETSWSPDKISLTSNSRSTAAQFWLHAASCQVQPSEVKTVMNTTACSHNNRMEKHTHAAVPRMATYVYTTEARGTTRRSCMQGAHMVTHAHTNKWPHT